MIGIIGGIGPMAGVDLAKKIIENTKAKKDQDHIPFVLISLPNNISDRTEYILGLTENNPAIPIAHQILSLESLGITHAIIACNTAHSPIIFDEIISILKSKNSKVSLINMVNCTLDKIVSDKSIKKVGVLSTLGSRKVKLYENKIIENNLKLIDLPENLAVKVHKAIYDPEYGIKTLSKVSGQARLCLYEALDFFAENQVDCVILGCTEIPLGIKDSIYLNMKIINPMEITSKYAIGKII